MKLLVQRLELPHEPGTTPPIIEGKLVPATFNVTQLTLGAIVSRAVSLILVFAGIGLLLMLLASGFEYLTSAGDAKKLESAKQRLTYSIVGFLIIFTAFWLVQLAGRIFGLTEVQTIFQ